MLQTQFASAARVSHAEIYIEVDQIASALTSNGLMREMLDAMNDMAFIVNSSRQILYANRAFVEALGIDAAEEIYGMRPGEAISCVHAGADRCGTTEACRTCGAVLAVLGAQRGNPTRKECRLRRRADLPALDLQVSAAPISVDGQPCTFVAVTDIGPKKRREALERTFFHDVLNMAGVVAGFTRLAGVVDPVRARAYAEKAFASCAALVSEIESHRDLINAEDGTLKVRRESVDVAALLRQLTVWWGGSRFSVGREVTVIDTAASVTVDTDQTLLGRALSNLIKNALEASSEGDTVTARAALVADGVEIGVHNPTAMSRETQLQVFGRSFSTRGEGRGLGTYSVKLLTEQYLGGRISFTSEPVSGTTFTIWLPKH